MSKSQEVPRKVFLFGLALAGEPPYRVDEHLDELEELADSSGGEVVGRAVQRRNRPDPATLIGKGKAEEIAEAAKTLGAEILIADDDLSPAQVKNLENATELSVMDRSALILEIFNLRARTREARTQVELAQLKYLLPRLTRRWTHLSRQAGGIGVRGGEGESQLEADRRMLRKRIARLEKQLASIEKNRRVQRRGRRGVSTIALAGYTNAGKSTLFNRLTGAGEYVKDQLFATLDSRARRGALDPFTVVVFSDTVGFIRKLPHHLVASFRSTLEVVTEADWVLHVVDRSHPAWEDQQRVGSEVLADLGVSSDRILDVYNKVDNLDRPSAVNSNGSASPNSTANPNDAGNGHGNGNGGEAIWVSATTGEGIDRLKSALLERVGSQAPVEYVVE